MKKGDVRREEILSTAERLFYTKGYEKTSVQDILTEMNYSKGGFYHHFDSKLSVLEAICELRAKETCDRAAQALERAEGSAADKLNAVFTASQILTSGQPGFVSLLLQVAYREDGVLMREKMKQRQLEGLLPLYTKIVAQGVEEQEFFVADIPAAAEMLLRMYLLFTDDIAFLLSGTESEERIMEAAVRKLGVYRTSIERMLIAPFGSVVMLEIRDLQILSQKIVRERLRRRADAMLSR